MPTDTNSGNLTQEDILADLRDELNVPRLCMNHPDVTAYTTHWRRGVVQFADYSCGCRYNVETQRFVQH